MKTKMNRNELSLLIAMMKLTHPHLEYKGCFDAPVGTKLSVLISECDADAKNPLSCVIARNLEDVKVKIERLLPVGYGKVMPEGITIRSDRAYIAMMDEVAGTFRILKFNHDGAWVVNSFDSEDPVKKQKMWDRINKADEGAIVRLYPFRYSQTTEGRAALHEAKVKREAELLANGGTLPKPKSCPQRGNRITGIAPRRATLTAKVEALEAAVAA